ncbi:uncharacterized protein LOC115985046 [Quercus lobata]|uniref:uncharacterized protein LOC115985046 n=1 Tax=Quercus lobata TaxID=97700 RepID=UPI0012473CB6|nr:uncharacterized protein LOC115985046 [Quercus lobata]
MFRPQIRRNVEVYVDDMLVKSQDEGRHLDDLQETFETLRQYHMKLNPSKCAFGVSSGKFFGFMVSHRGIEANPDKIRAILDMKPLQNTKEIQSLTGRVAALNSKRWIVHVDGSSTQHAGGIGVVLQSPEGDKLKHKVRLQYQATNNEVEYEALLKGLELAKSVEAKSICVMRDSQLIMGQVNGMYEAKEERMKKYLGRVMRLVKRFEKADFVQIPREENVEADTIAKEASADESLEKSDEVQYMPSIDVQEVQQVDNREDWMTPIISYLKDGRLPEEKDEAKKVRVRSARYVLMNEVLYKRGFSQPYLRCLAPDEANYVLREVHEGCQRFINVPRQPSKYLTPMVAPWPFAQWGLDILGPFPLGIRQMKFLVVGIDYFTKWVEAEPLANITQQNVKNFVWKNINHYSSPTHPQANDQAEVANRSLTIVRTSTGETPFKLAYGSDAVIPAEVHMANHRVIMYQDKDNEDQFRLNLDLIDEVRTNAEHRAAKYKNLMARQYDAMVKPRRFNIGDLVLRKQGKTTSTLIQLMDEAEPTETIQTLDERKSWQNK